MRLDELPTDRSWKRRAITLPLWFTLAVALPIVMPFVLPVTALVDLIRRNRLSLSRTMIFFTWYFVLESAGLFVAGILWLRHQMGLSDEVYEVENRKVQRWWARGLFWGTARIFAMEVELEGLDALEDPTPCIVLSRHASTLDTMLPIAVVRQMKRYRYVIKAELLTAPALDIVAQRFPNVFVVRGAANTEREVEKVLALSEDLEATGAVVMYPEGTRFSAEKRARLLEKFADDPEMRELTEELRNTLPPLREGVVRLLEHTNMDVVFIAHRGLDEASSMAELAGGGMTGVSLVARMWRIPAEEVPRTAEGLKRFLVHHWRRIDHFVREEDYGEGVEELPVASSG